MRKKASATRMPSWRANTECDRYFLVSPAMVSETKDIDIGQQKFDFLDEQHMDSADEVGEWADFLRLGQRQQISEHAIPSSVCLPRELCPPAYPDEEEHRNGTDLFRHLPLPAYTESQWAPNHIESHSRVKSWLQNCQICLQSAELTGNEGHRAAKTTFFDAGNSIVDVSRKSSPHRPSGRPTPSSMFMLTQNERAGSSLLDSSRKKSPAASWFDDQDSQDESEPDFIKIEQTALKRVQSKQN